MPRREAATAEDVAQSLACWFAELGYLEHGDALQIIGDEFGNEYVWTNARDQRGIRRDVLEALHALIPEAAWSKYFMPWMQLGPTEQPPFGSLHRPMWRGQFPG
jgi:hypothetical protein